MNLLITYSIKNHVPKNWDKDITPIGVNISITWENGSYQDQSFENYDTNCSARNILTEADNPIMIVEHIKSLFSQKNYIGIVEFLSKLKNKF